MEEEDADAADTKRGDGARHRSARSGNLYPCQHKVNYVTLAQRAEVTAGILGVR